MIYKGEFLGDMPTVGVLMQTGNYQELEGLVNDGHIQVVHGTIDALLSRDVGVFYRVSEDTRGLSNALGLPTDEVVGKSAILGRQFAIDVTGIEIIPIVNRRVGRHDFHNGYEDLGIRIRQESLNSGIAQVALLPDGFADLEGAVLDSGERTREEIDRAHVEFAAANLGVPVGFLHSRGSIGAK